MKTVRMWHRARAFGRLLERSVRKHDWRVETKFLILTLPLIAALTAVAVWAVQMRTMDNLREKLTQRARSLQTQIMADRQYYASVVVPRVVELGGTLGEDYKQAHGRFPLPATFVREVSEITSKVNEGYSASLISPWAINPDKGVKDQFQRDAFAYLMEHPTGQFIRTDTLEGQTVMRVLMGDRATARSCVDCHNGHPKSPRHDFKPGDLMGGLEITIPMDAYLNDTRRTLAATVLGGVVFSLLVAGTLMAGTRRMVTKPLARLSARMLAFSERSPQNSSAGKDAPRAGDEIRQLDAIFEEMRGTLVLQERALRDANAHLEQRVLERTEALQSLVENARLITTETSLDRFLQQSVETARRLTGARYAAIGVFDEAGERLVHFLTAGMDEAAKEAIGRLPSGQGLLGHLAHEEGVLRLKDLTQHPASVGFPPHHPPMRSFLGAAIRSRGRLYGRFYVTDKQGADEFTVVDEQMIAGLASQVGGAVEHARFIEELRTSREQHRATMAALPVSVVRMGKNWTIHFANRAFYDLVGRRPQDVIGRPLGDVFPAKGLVAFLDAMLAVHRDDGRRVDREFEGLTPSGDRRILRLHMSRVRQLDDGALVLAIEDVTEHKKAEAAIQEKELARISADRTNRAKSEFLSRMSHELRTPLNAILGFAQLLEMDPLTPDQRESITRILHGGQHLLSLINEVLDISRIETGHLRLSLEPVPLVETVRETLELIRPLAEQRRITMQGEPDQANGLHVKADRQRLRQVLLNLLSNAVKYNREGGNVTVTCARAADGRARVAVADTGPGISPEKLGRLFTPFDRLGAEQTDIEGTGLGLSLTKRLVETMGGRLGVDSVVGRGSEFSVELAVAPPAAVEAAPPCSSEPAAAGARRTVLYIEDNLSNLDLIKKLLATRPEITLLSAMQGRLGLDLARLHKPDLILLDLHLPDLGGEAVLLQLKADPSLREIPVVILSADATPGQIQRLRASGAHDYLTKPLALKQFLALISQTLASR
jgi:PAS domain S-box-containing protein